MIPELKTSPIPHFAARWISFGPYFAMFPVGFVLEVVERYTTSGDAILDPFAGRGTSVAAAAALGRRGFGVEINPVGWLYAHAKTAPAEEAAVLRRLTEVAGAAVVYADEANALPEFYHWCFSEPVRRFLLAARNMLRWREDPVDATLMAFVLLYLHGKCGQALSNQTRQQKSLAPAYSVRWWKERGMTPPLLDPAEFLAQRIRWRYAWGTPDPGLAEVRLGDAREILPRHQPSAGGYQLLLTSPPYCDVTCYYYDHWLRYWLLGGPELPTRTVEKWTRESRYTDRRKYRELLYTVFSTAAELMATDSTIYVRTDAREFTRQTTEEVLRDVFPKKCFREVWVPFRHQKQTALFGQKTSGTGEVDLILTN